MLYGVHGAFSEMALVATNQCFKELWGLASDFDFLRDFISLLSGAEVDRLSINYTLGLIKTQKGLTAS